MYVAITDNLIADVRRTIRNMCETEKKPFTNNQPYQEKILEDKAFIESIVTELWGEFEDLRPRLRVKDNSYSIAIQFQVENSDGIVFNGNQVTYILQTPKVRVPVWCRPPNMYTEYIPVMKKESDHPEFKNIGNNIRWAHECQMRWNKIEHQVTEFLRAAKSLNEALKLWPDLRRYIPASYLQRVDQKTERPKNSASAAAEALKKIDVDMINASTVLARLASSQAE